MRSRAAGAVAGLAALVLMATGCSSTHRSTLTGTSTTVSTSPTSVATTAAPSTSSSSTSEPIATTTSTTTSTAPTLGVSRALTAGAGFGQVRPSRVYLGGDPTGDIRNIVWVAWGGGRATGTGTSYYVAPGQPTSSATAETATIVAFDPGTCHGGPAYQAVEWYFPQHGGYFDPGAYVNACTGAYSPPNFSGFR